MISDWDRARDPETDLMAAAAAAGSLDLSPGSGDAPPGGGGSTGFGQLPPPRRVDRGYVREAVRLYAVTDPGCNAKVGRTMAEAVAQAVAGGATIIQIREKGSDGVSFLGTAKAAYKVGIPGVCQGGGR